MVANAIDKLFSKGDPIAIDMPMTTTAVIIYIGIIIAGCIVVSVADSFAAQEIAVRLSLSKAKGIFTQVGLLDQFNKLDLLRRFSVLDLLSTNYISIKPLFGNS